MSEKLTENCTKVLAVLCDEPEGYCLPFKPIMERAELDRSTVRRTCRLLRRKGLAEFHKGLWNDDGDVAGAGYSASSAGRQALEQSGAEHV